MIVHRKASFRVDDRWQSLTLAEAGQLDTAAVLTKLQSSADGLSDSEATRRLEAVGPNAVRTHGARLLEILMRQVKSPLLLLLVTAAAVSVVVGERTDAFIILGIIALSVLLSFFNEYQAARAVETLHSRIRHTVVARRQGRAISVNVTELVPGDVVRLDGATSCRRISGCWRQTR
jgi:Mg2+-importing ATPase